ncbi:MULTISPECIES: response regulator transcription factor [unclassified Paenibacillus]|uniref:response regulator transcription factor n=1 Tax=unclassified Paenibacillus TaxID=185978 RepID=UPI0009573B29|nr:MULTISPECIES: response regulator transcription factor [unclassified Paenibacillus]ASS68011.1 response regulator transcription factor [Paenibacillus sp. RUD330]SIR41524.1 two-component system, NarL family, response regulator DesR [Paenibacillus sp. RU4X]SIR51655.1 two-component system, NarL family, response regulator DesR [Paenibacillus sp. RU4T]
MKVVLAEDQGMLRGAMAALLGMEDDIEVAGQAADGLLAWELIQSVNPDLCVLDIEMPLLTGLDVAEKLKESRHPCKVVILTTFSRSGYFQRAMKAGARGFLLKDSPVSELAAALRTVHAGGRAVSPELALSFWEAENPLNEREREILKLAGEGLSAGDIAGRLFLSAGTVRNYLSEAIQKLDARNRIDACAIAEKNGWLD